MVYVRYVVSTTDSLFSLYKSLAIHRPAFPAHDDAVRIVIDGPTTYNAEDKAGIIPIPSQLCQWLTVEEELRISQQLQLLLTPSPVDVTHSFLISPFDNFVYRSRRL